MKKLLLLFAVLLFASSGIQAATTVLKGKIYNHKDSLDFARIKIVTTGFTGMKQYEWYSDIEEDGSFKIELETEYAIEIYFFFKHKYIPLLLYPNSEIILKFNAKTFLEARKPETTVVQEGRGAQVNKWLHDFLNQYNLKFPSWEEKNRREEMSAPNYLEYKKSELEAKLQFAEKYRKGRWINDPVFQEWMEQHIKLISVRDFLSFNFVNNKKTGAGPYSMMGSDYYYFWDSYSQEFPKKIISFAYKRFVATYVNYDMLFIQQQSSDQKKASKKEQLKDMIEKLNADISGHSREAAMGILLGVHLDLPDLKQLIDADLVREVEDEEIHFQLLEKFKRVNGIVPELKKNISRIDLNEDERDVMGVIREKFPDKVILIDVWATWCGSCIRTMKEKYPSFVRQFKPEDVAFVFICVGSVENTWAQRVNELSFAAHHLIVSEDQFRRTQRGFNIQGLPRYILLNKKGRVELANAPGPGLELRNKITSLLGE